MKRFIAFILAFAMMFSGINFTAMGADGCIQAFAFSVGEVATDTYVSYNQLLEDIVANSSEVKQKMQLILNGSTNTVQTRASESIYDDHDSETNDQDYTSDMSTLWRLSTDKYKNGIYNGFFTYEQNNIDAAAQIKSGKWLTDSEFEAMTGTPTTIDQFITMGGSQWIVDLQYRVTNADYVRKYHFEVPEIANYMYRKEGNVKNGGTNSYYAEPVMTTTNDGWHEAKEYDPGTIGGRVYDGIPNAPDLDLTGHIKPALAGTDHPAAHTFNNWGYRYNEGFTKWDCAEECEEDTNEVTLSGGSTFRYPKKDNFTQSGLSQSDENCTPNMLEAKYIREAVINFMDSWKQMYEQSDDNYRADQGNWDAAYDGESDRFMYTYGGLVRRDDGAGGGYSMSHPALVTSYYDWSQGSGASKIVEYPKGGFGSFDEIAQSILDGDDTRSTEQKMLFPLRLSDSVVSGIPGISASDIAGSKPNMYAVGSKIQKIMKNVRGTELQPDDLFWLKNISNAYAFGGNVKTGMGMSADMGGSISGFPSVTINGYTYDFSGGGFSEIGFWYYYTMYYMYVNFGWCLFSNEIETYFGDLPGIVKDDAGAEKFMQYVFGHSTVLRFNKMVPIFQGFSGLNVPFSIMSRGVNLDSSYDAAGSTGNKRNTADSVSTWDLTELFFPGVKWKDEGFTTYITFALDTEELYVYNYYNTVFCHDDHTRPNTSHGHCRKSIQLDDWSDESPQQSGVSVYLPFIDGIEGGNRICNDGYDGHNDDCAVPGDESIIDSHQYPDSPTGDDAGAWVLWDICEDGCTHHPGSYGIWEEDGHQNEGHPTGGSWEHLHRDGCHSGGEGGGSLLEGFVIHQDVRKGQPIILPPAKDENINYVSCNNPWPKNSASIWTQTKRGQASSAVCGWGTCKRAGSTSGRSFIADGQTTNVGAFGEASTWFISSTPEPDSCHFAYTSEWDEDTAPQANIPAALPKYMLTEVDKDTRHRILFDEISTSDYNYDFYTDEPQYAWEWRDGFCVDVGHVSDIPVRIHWGYTGSENQLDNRGQENERYCPGNEVYEETVTYAVLEERSHIVQHGYDSEGNPIYHDHFDNYEWVQHTVTYQHYANIHTHVFIGGKCYERRGYTGDTDIDNITQSEIAEDSLYHIEQDDCGGTAKHYMHHGHARTIQCGNDYGGLSAHSGPKKDTNASSGILLRDHDEHWVEIAEYFATDPAKAAQWGCTLGIEQVKVKVTEDSEPSVPHLQYDDTLSYPSTDWAFDGTASECAVGKHGEGADTHCARKYYEAQGTVKVTSDVGITKANWESSKTLAGTEQVIGQRFHNVEWLDIDSYNIWVMNRGFSKGLSLLLAEPVTLSGEYNKMETLMVSDALSQTGYTLFNIEDDDSVSPNNGVAYDTTDRNNLQYNGRVANSFNWTSEGNQQSKAFKFYKPYSGGKARAAVASYAVNDVPALGTAESEMAMSQTNMNLHEYINGDAQAFYFLRDKSTTSKTDDLYFEYNPYAQGGRSEKDHWGFVNQAMALSLYWCAQDSNFNTPADCPTYGDSRNKVAYSNSILIQGDYLVMDYNDETYNKQNPDGQTLAGYIYDTWMERGEHVKGHEGDLFGLVKDGRESDALARYNRYCRWIPGRLSYMLGRSNKENIWNKNGDLGTDENIWLIHTFSQGINDDKHSCWDSIYNDEQGKCDEGKNGDPGDIREHNTLVQLKSVLKDNNDGTYNIIDLTYTKNHKTPAQYPHALLQKAMYGDGGTYDSDWLYGTSNEQSGWVGYGANPAGGTNGDHDIVRTVHDYDTEQEGWLQTSTQQWTYHDSYLNGGKDLDGNGKSSNYKKFGIYEVYNIGDGGDAGEGKHIFKDKHYNTGKLGNGSTADGGDSFSQFYPWMQYLNLDRYMGNDRWQTGYAFNEYVSVGKHVDGNNIGATADVHTQRHVTDVPAWEAFYKNDIDLSASDSRVYVNAAYVKGPSPGNFGGRPNDIVVYNPVSTQSAHIVPSSEYLPDAGNVGMSDKDDPNSHKYTQSYLNSFLEYVKRDWRVATKYELDAEYTGGEKYMATSGFIFESLTRPSDRTTHTYQIIDRKYEVERGNMTKEEALKTDRIVVQSDYEIETETLPPFTFTDMGGTTTHDITRSGTYDMTLYESNSKNVSVAMELIPGDQIIVNNPTKTVSVNYSGAADGKITYSQFKEAYKKMCDDILLETGEETFVYDEEVVDEYLPLKYGMQMSIGVAGTTMTTRKGQAFSMKLRFEGTTANPIEIEQTGYHIWNSAVPDVENNAVDVTYYFETTAPEAPMYFPVTIRRDAKLMAFAGNAFTNIPTVICHIGSGMGTYGGTVYTTEYEYGVSPTGVREIETTSWHHSLVCDLRGEWQIAGVNTITLQGFYLNIKSASTSTVKLSDTVTKNPHMVMNADWRYYVLGYMNVTTSTVITSINQINEHTDILFPSGLTISAAEIDNLATLGKLGVYRDNSGNHGLIDLNDDRTYEHSSRYTGLTVSPHFNIMSFGGTENYFDKALTFAETADPAFDIAKYRVEMVFVAQNSNGFDANLNRKVALYSVAFSTSYQHRISTSEDTYVTVTDMLQMGMDWKLVFTAIIEFEEEVYYKVFANALSLDDEFLIYWDNFGDLTPYDGKDAYGNSLRNLYDTQPVIGDGWDNTREAHRNTGYGTVNVARYCNFSSVKNEDYWKYISDYTNVTDTTKWIYEKYVIFNTDMYAFTKGHSYTYDDTKGPKGQDGDWDPTTPAYDENGDANGIVYIPAGSKVYLGYYLNRPWPGSGSHSSSSATYGVSDNSGRFVDYGYNYTSNDPDDKPDRQKTRDPNGNFYTYHFWNPLSNGEMDGTGTVQFVVNGINSVNDAWDVHYSDGSHPQRTEAGIVPDWHYGLSPTMKGSVTERHRYHQPTTKDVSVPDESGRSDEWGNKVLRAVGLDMSHNVYGLSSGTPVGTSIHWNESDVYNRYNMSASSARYTLIGRIGGLTLYDTGDPRYQDSFKQVNPNPDEREYAIAPIVWAIKRYSNIDGEEGSQFKYLVDMLDARGRYLITTPNIDSATGKGETHESYQFAISGDSYSHAAWYLSKAYIAGRRELLPLTSDFNIHEEVRNEVKTVKLGYEVHCSLTTIGNYFGSLDMRPGDNSTSYVNTNNDYGQTKVQIHTLYSMFDPETGEFFPVDAYMRDGSTYRCINAGSEKAYEDDGLLDSEGNEIDEEDPYYLQTFLENKSPVSLIPNQDGLNESEHEYNLDQNMLRESVTVEENKKTYYVLHDEKSESEYNDKYGNNKAIKDGITTSLLDPYVYGSDEIGGTALDESYTYGNAQMEFLREFNRTFIGGTTLALNEISYESGFAGKVQRNATKFAQKWRFTLGLPSSTVFVKHGDPINPYTMIDVEKGYWLICLVDVYSIGEKWLLHYESNISGEDIKIKDTYYPWEKWNVYKESFPWLIPVYMCYLGAGTSADDKDIRGTH